MKARKIIYVLGLFALICIQACKKTSTTAIGTSSLIVVNAIINSTGLIPNFNADAPLKYYSNASSSKGSKLNFGSNWEYSGFTNELIPLSFADMSDTTKTVYQNNLNFPSGSIHSLYLCGTLAAPESLLLTDTIPSYNPADSVGGFRFINLSAGSNPVSVDIAGNANGSEVQSLEYKQITNFKTHLINNSFFKNGGYTFEFRDVTTGNLLASTTVRDSRASASIYRNRNATLVLYGLPGQQNVRVVYYNLQNGTGNFQF